MVTITVQDDAAKLLYGDGPIRCRFSYRNFPTHGARGVVFIPTEGHETYIDLVQFSEGQITELLTVRPHRVPELIAALHAAYDRYLAMGGVPDGTSTDEPSAEATSTTAPDKA
jgi:hypothetical protein